MLDALERLNGVEAVPVGPSAGEAVGPVMLTAPQSVDVRLPKMSFTLSPRPKLAPAVTEVGELLTVTLWAAAAATLT